MEKSRRNNIKQFLTLHNTVILKKKEFWIENRFFKSSSELKITIFFKSTLQNFQFRLLNQRLFRKLNLDSKITIFPKKSKITEFSKSRILTQKLSWQSNFFSEILESRKSIRNRRLVDFELQLENFSKLEAEISIRNKVWISELNFGQKVSRKRYGTEQKFVEWLEYIYSRDKIIVTLIWLSDISP